MKHVRGIFISHEHSDHIRGVEVLSKRYELPVYITEKTHQNSRMRAGRELVRNFSAEEAITIGNLVVKAVPKNHDAVDPHSFTVSSGEITVGIFTDLGMACPYVISHFKGCQAAFLEANYDEHMLLEGRYPAYLKKRISGDFGHLSNTQALELFINHRSPILSHLFLSHISAENNKPEIVKELFDKHRGNTRIEVASRFEETKLFFIEGR